MCVYINERTFLRRMASVAVPLVTLRPITFKSKQDHPCSGFAFMFVSSQPLECLFEPELDHLGSSGVYVPQEFSV